MKQQLEALQLAKKLSVYNVFDDNQSGEILEIALKVLGNSDTVRYSATLFNKLIGWAEKSVIPMTGNLWQNYILDLIVTAVNTFTRMAASGNLSCGDSMSRVVKAAVCEDMKKLKNIISIGFTPAAGLSDNIYLELIESDLTDQSYCSSAEAPQRQILNLKKRLLKNDSWDKAADILLDFHMNSGCGPLCLFHAFLWDGKHKKLRGIPDPDPIRIENLVGYSNERGKVLMNTERILKGLPAGNILLYGDRGTGKSSTVKSLIHRYGSRGLRIIEIPKIHLADYQLILAEIKNTCLKFILFIDDLSFEDNETEYKTLKSILDGSLQARPDNVVIYATSNRRHLVREYFEERQSDVHSRDTLQEKLSLSERFSVTVLFLAPDQELYLEMVEALARQKGLSIPAGELRDLALEWERWNNGRSGRTARQFIEQLITG
ncbi:MAG: ATP-binding protein [Bacillota bacterium]